MMISCAVFVKRIEVTCNECAFPLKKEDGKVASRNAIGASLVFAATKKKLSCVKELIAAEADVNAVCQYHGNGALMLAVTERHVERLKELPQELKSSK